MEAQIDLKSGDRIAVEYRGRYEIHVIEKITPGGQIVLDDGSRYKNGHLLGESGGLHFHWLYPLVPPIEAKIRRQAALDYIEEAGENGIFHSLSTEDLEAVVSILKG